MLGINVYICVLAHVYMGIRRQTQVLLLPKHLILFLFEMETPVCLRHYQLD